jgi:hypothetical protein
MPRLGGGEAANLHDVRTRPPLGPFMMIFRVSTATLVLVARDIALANAAIIASSEPGRS